MYTIYKDLPEYYEQFSSIDMKDNKKEFVLLNALSFIAIIPFFFILGAKGLTLKITSLWHLVGILLFFVGYILIIIIHEFIHAYFFKRNSKVRVTFKFHGFAASASVPGVYFQKKHYRIVALAPFVIITSVCLPFLFTLTGGAFLILYFIFAMHFSGCVGDFYVFYKLLKMPKETLIEDYGVGMRFFKPSEKSNKED
ncbi:DUF3267 domain-containing protein [Haloplasma contractile]|uniref:Integral membrane protein n=1 Tax=Haloplasma contractile SSD-17B TaxID=1033810 RepID=U2DR13_9MOLU|nr:DUF3267 domain-containing protein [Haloplasma contractile]ERJ11007.1 integral membrane protein [Haloplasma contractile SSD-17B]